MATVSGFAAKALQCAANAVDLLWVQTGPSLPKESRRQTAKEPQANMTAMFHCCVELCDEIRIVMVHVDALQTCKDSPAVVAPSPAREEELEHESPKSWPKKEKSAYLQHETFDLVLQKDGALGLQLELKPYGLAISRLGEGSFAAQNSHGSKKAQVHDIIFKVNGKTGNQTIFRELQSCSGQVTFTIARPPVIEVTIAKNGKPFGVGLGSQADCQTLDIVEIRDGALKDYLASAGHLQISEGDSIISVNGTSLNCEHMMDILRTSNDLKMQICRASLVGSV